jgi:hypothetical protein
VQSTPQVIKPSQTEQPALSQTAIDPGQPTNLPQATEEMVRGININQFAQAIEMVESTAGLRGMGMRLARFSVSPLVQRLWAGLG